MYLLDTNVLSELRRARRADANVMDWAARRPAASFWISVISVLEIELGVLRIERRDAVQGAELRKWLEGQVLQSFEQRILPVDLNVARRAAALHVPDPRADRDALIAATALVHGMTVITRNIADFEATGVPLVDPWMPRGGE
jgi:predicted nucleic acid-binding protein